MSLDEYKSFIPSFLKKLEDDGLSKSVINKSKTICKYFTNYCINNKINKIDMEVIRDFYNWKYEFDIDNISGKRQSELRRPLIILMEYYENGVYLKTHIKSNPIEIPLKYTEIFDSYKKEYVDSNNSCTSRKKFKLYTIGKMLIYFDEHEKNTFDLIKINDVSEYILYLSSRFSLQSVRVYKNIIREFFEWCYKKKIISFSGKQILPIIKNCKKNKLISAYSKEEIKRMLESIDNNNKKGKKCQLVICLLAYYGLRAGDIINLKFSNIDFENNKISLVQQKTKVLLTLPLLDEVKYSLLDYIKNGRNESVNKEYIFSTDCAPYTKINSTTGIYRIVNYVMNLAKINYENKRHGPHSLRHSFATIMINHNIPITSISQALGHTSTESTEIYITKDTTHLRELTLEVPCEK